MQHFIQLRRTRRKKDKSTAGAHPHQTYEIYGVILLSLSILLFYCTTFRTSAGQIGNYIGTFLWNTFGGSTYLLLFYLIQYAIIFLRSAFPIKPFRNLVGQIFIFLAVIAYFNIFDRLDVRWTVINGGIIGDFIAKVLSYLFSPVGANILLFTFLIVGITLSTNFSLPKFIAWLHNRVVTDWQEWQEERHKNPPVRITPAILTPVRDKIKPEELTPLEPIIIPKPAEIITNSGKDKPGVPLTIAKPVLPTSDVKKPSSIQKEDKKDGKKKDDTKDTVTSPTPAVTENPFTLPPLNLLDDPARTQVNIQEETLHDRGEQLIKALTNFGVEAKLVDIIHGPVVTRFDLEPAPGVKIHAITSLSDDIALSLKTERVRIFAPIPGKGAVGVEIPNSESRLVGLKDILLDKTYAQSISPLTIGLGKTTSGEACVTDLIPMPHLLIAGATGSGKSVCVHSILTSIIYKSTPNEVKFVLIDPKRLELFAYDGIPYLYDPDKTDDKVSVITDAKEAAKALIRLVKVMEYRYQKFARATVRNIEGYNKTMKEQNLPGEFYIVVVIDELADLMLIAPKEVEDSIMRLAQMARAVGIHLVLATQRPSVDVITGVIKANLPSRIAFQVLSKVDSRVILDTIGAEDLLGRGDMLFLPPGASKPVRLQCAYVSEKEVKRITDYLRTQGKPNYTDVFATSGENVNETDQEMVELVRYAVQLVHQWRRVSSDLLRADQRIGHKYALILSRLERDEFIYKPEGTKSWKINFDKIDQYLTAGDKNYIPLKVTAESNVQKPVE